MESAQWRRGFARLAPLGLSFDLQLYWPQMDKALALANAFPDTMIVLEHFGMVADAVRKAWRRGARRSGASRRRRMSASNYAASVSARQIGRQRQCCPCSTTHCMLLDRSGPWWAPTCRWNCFSPLQRASLA
ncbi:hypothetical protein EOA33_04045 [Mesorhizobium sp. M4A.F.Ca.ET.050.02.1.1]|nr:hypothetical protein EOA33_04045 [Mesorhizobium sp. M4A.F.Ca.ET.050.02.1.1]